MTTTKKKSAPAPAPTLAAEPDKRPIVLGIIPKGELREIPLERIVDPKNVPDRVARPEDAKKIEELARSLREVGQLQPIMVEELADGRFCRVFGRRRLAAAKLAEIPTLKALVVPPLQDDVRRTIVAIENMQRQDLTPAEEHLAVGELMQLAALDAAVSARLPIPHLGKLATAELVKDLKANPAAFKANSHDALLDPKIRSAAVDVVAAMLAKTRSWVLDRLYVSRLGPKGQTLVRDGKLPLTHAREIAKVADPNMREELAEDFAAGGINGTSETEAGRLEELQHEVSKSLFTLRQVGWKLDVPVGDKPACTTCPHNSKNNPGLFDGTDDQFSTKVISGKGWGGYLDQGEINRAHEAGICTLHSCWIFKNTMTKGAVAAAAKTVADGGTPKLKPWINPETVEKRAKERKKAVRTHSHRAAPKQDPAKEEATRKLVEAHTNHCKAILNAAAAKVNENPAARVYFDIFDRGRYRLPAEQYKKGLAMTRSDLIKLVDDALAKPKKFEAESVWQADSNDVKRATQIAAALGIKTDPAPVLADFLPKTDKAAAPAPGKKKAKKAGKKGGGK